MDMNWDDFRIFLAVSQTGGLKKAARQLNLHHSTCARRLTALEDRLGSKLFERKSEGYVPTQAGRDVARSMRFIQDEFHSIERDVAGKDLALEGPIKLSMTHGFAQYLLMPDLVSFMRDYPLINLQLNATYEFSDLARREADVAIRHVDDPPLSLSGHKLGRMYWCAYASSNYLEQHDVIGHPEYCHWIGWGDARKHLEWPGKQNFPLIPVRGNLYSEVSQLSAAKNDLGIASLPCYIADMDPDLVRIPNAQPEPRDWLWVLVHPDMWRNARVKALLQHIKGAFEEKKALLEGRFEF